MSIIIAILIFGVIVLIHEFGHFIVARWSKIDVLEFSIGMGPSIYTYHGKKTDYSIKLFPIGGSCRMAGEDSGEETEIKEGTFNSRPVWYRLAVIFAGPLFNFILSFILALFIVSVAGVDKPVISEVKEGYPAYNAGVMSGDVIKSIDKKDIHLYRELMLYLYMNPEKTIDLKVERDVNGTKEIKEFSITPKYDEENSRYMIGIVSADREKVSNPLSVITYSIYEIKYNIDSTLSGLMQLIKGKASTKQISGPVGIVATVGSSVDESMNYGFISVILTIANMTMLLSSTLGIMNLLPIPALDGGRILFLLVEAILRKPLNRTIEAYIHFGGFVLLMIFMVFILYNDIVNLIFG